MTSCRKRRVPDTRGGASAEGAAQRTTNTAALRIAGDARYPVAAGASSMAIVLGGRSWLLGIHLGLGLTGLWIAYAADEWIRGLLMWRRWVSHGWVPHARATHRRLRRRKVVSAS